MKKSSCQCECQCDAAIRRAETWVRAMQSSNGGWGAFEKDNNRWILTRIPFCDFGEVLDPPSADLTGHKLEALGLMGYDQRDPAVRKAVDYILSEQESDGSWFGRWGVNHIYGTALVLPGLRAVGFDMDDPRIRRAGDWLLSKQSPDGGWGESCASYMDDSLRAEGPPTPSQTAWAIMGLLAIGRPEYDLAIQRGVNWLLAHQHNGSGTNPITSVAASPATASARCSGVLSRLDYLRGLGVNTLLIYPPFANDRQPLGSFLASGYRVSDWQEIDRNLGTKGQFKALTDALHGGSPAMRLIVDLPIGMSGVEHPWNANQLAYVDYFRAWGIENIGAAPRWHDLMAATEVGDRETKRIDCDGRGLFVYRQDGTYRVYDSRCPHQVTNIPHLALHGTELTCPKHHWKFDITTGQSPAKGTHPLKSFEAKVENGRLVALW